MSIVIQTPRGIIVQTKNGKSQLIWNKNFGPERTKNFTGAEIEGLVKSATSFALEREVY